MSKRMFSKWGFPAMVALIAAATWALSPRKSAGPGTVTVVGNQSISGLGAYIARERRHLEKRRPWQWRVLDR